MRSEPFLVHWKIDGDWATSEPDNRLSSKPFGSGPSTTAAPVRLARGAPNDVFGI